MARKLVSQEDVYEAADEMVRAGKTPTTIGVHRMIDCACSVYCGSIM